MNNPIELINGGTNILYMQSTSHKLKNIRELFEKYIYRGPIRTVIQRSGFNRVLDYIYRRSLMVSYRVDSRRRDTIYTVSLDNMEVDYHMTTGKERDFLPRFTSVETEGVVLRTIIEELSPGDVFYDIGSNVGQYACFAAQILDGEDIHCFEPQPKSADRLRENLVLNGLDATIHQVALSGSDGMVEFDVGDDMEGGMGRIVDKKTKQSVTIPTRSVDSFREDSEIPPPDVVKVDIDGVEYDLIPGMRETLENSNCRLIVLEMHPKQIKERGGKVEELVEMLKSYGFDGKRLRSHEKSNSYHMLFNRGI